MLRRPKLSGIFSALLLLAAARVVSVGTVQAQEIAGTVLVQTGQVSVLQSGGYLKALSPGDHVQPRQIIVTGPDGFAKFQIQDGSTFEVYANSKVTFRSSSGLTDLLNLIIGRVKVFIDHSRGPNYKDVTTPTAVISVRGTVFDVVVEDLDGTTFVTVDDGLVQVRNLTAPGGSPYLKPGDSLRVFRGQPLIAAGIDKGNVFRGVLRAAQDAVYQVVYGRQGGATGPVGPHGGTPGGAGQGDDPKGGNGGSSAPPSGSAPPVAPAPPIAPGGGG